MTNAMPLAFTVYNDDVQALPGYGTFTNFVGGVLGGDGEDVSDVAAVVATVSSVATPTVSAFYLILSLLVYAIFVACVIYMINKKYPYNRSNGGWRGFLMCAAVLDPAITGGAMLFVGDPKGVSV